MKIKHIEGLVIRAEGAPEGSPTIVCASTDQPDRMDDIVDQASWQLAEYGSNPVVLWAHDRSLLPVAKAVDTVVVEGQLRQQHVFDESTQMGADVARQVREGFLSTVSVGFRAGRAVPRSQMPKDDPRYKAVGYGMVYYDCVLFEVSYVPIPANPGAVVLQRSVDDAAEMTRRAMAVERAELVEQIRAVLVVELGRALDARGETEAEPQSNPNPASDDWLA